MSGYEGRNPTSDRRRGRGHAWAVAIVLAATPAGLGARPVLEPRTVGERVLQAIQDARTAAGHPPLDHRSDLDAVARARADRIAALPERRRLADPTPLADDLEAHAVRRYHRVLDHVILLLGVSPVEGVLRQWRAYGQAWSTVTGAEIDAVGFADATAVDGTYVFVAVLLEEPAIPDDLAAFEREVERAVAGVRSEHRLPGLTWHEGLAAVARSHSEDMARRGYLAHETPEGAAPVDRVRAAGIDYVRLGENIAFNHRVSDPIARAIEGWLTSPPHRKELLSRKYTHTGIGVAVDEDGGIYFTQLFLVPPR